MGEDSVWREGEGFRCRGGGISRVRLAVMLGTRECLGALDLGAVGRKLRYQVEEEREDAGGWKRGVRTSCPGGLRKRRRLGKWRPAGQYCMLFEVCGFESKE